MEIISEARYLIAKGKTLEALQVLRNSGGIFDNSVRGKFDVLSSRYFKLQDHTINKTIGYEEETLELNKINNAIIQILNNEALDEKNYKENEGKYEQIILDLGENYQSISRTARNAIRMRKKYEIVKFIAEKLNEYPSLISKFKDTENQAILGGIAYKIKLTPSVYDLEILKRMVKNCKSNYVKGQVVNAIGEIVYTAELRIGDDDEIHELLNEIEDKGDFPLKINIERVKAALDFLLLYGKKK